MGATIFQVDAGDTAWLLVASALVMLMIPGLSLFYGGLVQKKNVLSTLMHCFFALALVSVQWALCGYSLAFGSSHGGLVGGGDFLCMRHIGLGVKEGTRVPHLLFFAYQGMFAAITPALLAGAYAERLKLSAFCLLTLGWTTLVYDPIAHWVWSPDGWLARLGALDFAGGTVVHVSSGFSALVVAVVVGRRLGQPRHGQPPHDLKMTVLGAGLLWFGWFGFNAGAALQANGLAALSFVDTQLAAAAGAIGWGVVEWRRLGKLTVLGVASGAVAGLVGITPAAGYVSPLAALFIGGGTGALCFYGILLKQRFGYDDALDAFGVHGIGGAFGALATGLFADRQWNPAGADGLFAGQLRLVGAQLLGLVAAALYAGLMTRLLLFVVDRAVGLRVARAVEEEGLDRALHGESAEPLVEISCDLEPRYVKRRSSVEQTFLHFTDKGDP